MKAKRLTALALAALMAASTTSVALAIRVDDDLVFADDGYYKYNSDTNRIESVDRRDDYQPGDDVYLRLDSSVSLPKEQTYNVYADWPIGESWVKDVEIVYRKGDVIKTTTYDWKFTFDGTSYSGTGATKNDDATKQSLIDSKLTEEVKNAYKSKHWDSATGYVVNDKFYANVEEAAKAAGFEKQLQGNQYTYNGKTGTLNELGLAAIPNSGFIYNNTYDSTTDAKTILKNLSLKDGDDVIYSVDATTSVYVDNDSSNFGEVKDQATGTQKDNVYVITVKGSDGVNKKYWFTDEDGAKQVLIQKLGAKEAQTTDGYYITTAGESLGKVVPASQVTQASGDTWVDVSRMSYPTAEDALKSKNINKTAYYVEKGKATTNGEVGVVDANAKLNEAVANAKNSFTWTEKTVTEPQYEYWVKITTKDSTTTKDIDVVGTIYVGEGTSKTSVKKNGDKFSADFTLTNSEPTNSDYDEATDYVSIEPGTRAVVSFADDASDEFEVEFGDDARFVFNARGQGKLNLAYNTKYNREFAYDYDDANIDFINFEGEPTTNRTGTLYIYADEDSYIYEVTSKGAKKINGAYYDDDEEAWVIRTRNLTSYAISDKKLKTVDQMNNGSSSSSSSKPGSNSGSGSNNGKPNPDTGR